MTNIIDFTKAKEDRLTYMTGPMVCINCKHEWVGTRPTGLISVECPECGLTKGVGKGTVIPNDGDPLYLCHCGCGYFTVIAEGILCANCGTMTELELILKNNRNER